MIMNNVAGIWLNRKKLMLTLEINGTVLRCKYNSVDQWIILW